MEERSLEAVVQDYLDAFASRDLAACMTYFTEDADIHFAMGHYRGTADIEQWHQDRFKAGMRILQVDAVKVEPDAATVDLVVTSNLAKLWRMDSVAARAELTFREGQIREARFGLRTAIPLERWAR